MNVILALTIASILYILGRRLIGHPLAFFTALLFLSYDQSIIHFRWIYPHNAVALGFALCALMLTRKSNPRNDWTAGLGLSIAAMSHPLFAHGAISAWFCRLKCLRAWFRLAIPPALVIAISFAFAIARFWPQNLLFEDLASLFAFYHKSDQETSLHQTALNIVRYFGQDFFHLGAIIGGFICLTRKRFYQIAIFLMTISFLLLKNRSNIPIFYYQAVTLLPILCLAWGGGLFILLRWLRSKIPSAKLMRVAAVGAMIFPIVLIVKVLPGIVSGHLISRNDFWVTQSVPEVEGAARWVNEHVSPNDLVLAGPNLGWLLRCHVTDLLQATLWDGFTTFPFDKPISHKRFLLPADYTKARYVVIGDIDQRWTVIQPNVGRLVQKLIDNRWPVVWKGNYYVVLQNPAFAAALSP